MARRIRTEPSRTLAEFRLLPGFTARECSVDQVSLRTLVTAEPESFTLEIPLVSAAMQSVSGSQMAIALGEEGGLAVLFCSQSPANEAAMVREVKAATPASPTATRSADGRFLVAAAVNTHDHAERVPALVDAGADLLFVDASHGHSAFQADTIAWINAHCPTIPVIGGNVVTAEGFSFLVGAGAAGVKVGMGSGSICITQEQKGTGRGLATALIEVCGERDRHTRSSGRYVPIVADGGLVTAKDVVMALAIGADTAMLGRFFARADESTNPKVKFEGRWFKPYWGEGSNRARAWKEARYHQSAFEEGIDALVECAGPLHGMLAESLAMIRASMSTTGAASIPELHRIAELELVSGLSIREGQPHDVLLAPTTPPGAPSDGT
jgi:IMP dehydrogenase